MEIFALLTSKISVLLMHQFGFLHGTGQPDISEQMWVPYIDVNFIGNGIFLTFGGCTWIPSTGKTLNFCRFLPSLYLTTNMGNTVAFCFNKIPAALGQSSAFSSDIDPTQIQKVTRSVEQGEGRWHMQGVFTAGELFGATNRRGWKTLYSQRRMNPGV